VIPKLDYKSTTCLLSTITVGSVGACLQYGGRMPTVSVTTRGNKSFFPKTIWRRSGGGEHRGRRVNGATQIEQVRDGGSARAVDPARLGGYGASCPRGGHFGPCLPMSGHRRPGAYRALGLDKYDDSCGHARTCHTCPLYGHSNSYNRVCLKCSQPFVTGRWASPSPCCGELPRL
jgi:hypothetical protein